MLGGLLLSGGAAFGEAYATPESRAALAALVASLPPALAGVYGNPFPMNVEMLGGSIAWKTAASLGLIACLWSILALSSTIASEARRGSLELVAVTPLGTRRIALEKLAAHLTVMALVVVVVAVSTYVAGTAFATLPGDDIPWSAAIGFALWVGLVGLASGSIAFALAPAHRPRRRGRHRRSGHARSAISSTATRRRSRRSGPSRTSPGSAGRWITSPRRPGRLGRR